MIEWWIHSIRVCANTGQLTENVLCLIMLVNFVTKNVLAPEYKPVFWTEAWKSIFSLHDWNLKIVFWIVLLKWLLWGGYLTDVDHFFQTTLEHICEVWCNFINLSQNDNKITKIYSLSRWPRYEMRMSKLGRNWRRCPGDWSIKMEFCVKIWITFSEDSIVKYV